MRALPVLWGEPITPAVTGSGKEGCPLGVYEDADLREGNQEVYAWAHGGEALKQGFATGGDFAPNRGH